MHKIILNWPELAISEVIDNSDTWSLRQSFKVLNSDEAVVASFNPYIDNENGVFSSILVSDITATEDSFSCTFPYTTPQTMSLNQDTIISVRRMSKPPLFASFLNYSVETHDFFPDNLNRSVSLNHLSKINFFIMNNNNLLYEYKSTQIVRLNLISIKSTIEKVLKAYHLSSVDFYVRYFVDQGEDIFITDGNLNAIINNGLDVMNIGLKAQSPSKAICLSNELNLSFL